MRAASPVVSPAELDRLRELPVGRRVTVTREGDGIPPEFVPAKWSLPWTARRVYREPYPTDPVVMAVFEEVVVLRRERFHPHAHPLYHLLYDRFVLLGVLVVAWLVARRRRKRGNDPRR
ncbi:hypothetical protein [Halomarina oriensis]|uniref:Uncharacterized protein n=1 Tax=Halomarina oriensis TaxID=671145 RepID=A0A6B0GU61_9EURY|nr:hypothetical protein [Halomarina oriensis]MWG35675.1 hypothetical protein [Halomarina oriensis]